MTSRRFGGFATLPLLLAIAAASPVRAEVPVGCTVEVRSALSIGNASAFDGDLVVTAAGGRARLGKTVRGADGTAVVAENVILGNGADAFDVVATSLRRGSGVAVRGTLSSGAFPRATSCTIAPATCGDDVVRVEKHGTRTLQPKIYGDLVVEDGATVALAPGVYTFCSIRAGRHVSLSVAFDGPTVVAVTGDLVLGNGASIASSSASGGSRASFEVGGSRVKLGAHSRVDAVIRSPLARLSAGTSTALTGAACARTADTGWRFAFHCGEGVPATTSTSSTLANASTSSSTTSSSTTSSSSSTSSTSTSSTVTTSTTIASTTILPSTSTTSEPATTSIVTSSSTTTSSNASTSSTSGPASTSTSSTTSSSTTTSTSSTTHPPLCGNAVVNAGETCDDGNNSDNDACPADCVIDACTPITTTQRFVSLQFTPPPGGLVAGLTVLLDYPEGKVDLPGNGTSFPSGTLSGAPSGSTVSVNDLNFNGKGHAVRVTIAGANGTALPAGQIVRFKFQDCTGASVPTAGQFLCSVVAATDPFLNHVDGVRCFAVLP